jgi:hypothetical protein
MNKAFLINAAALAAVSGAQAADAIVAAEPEPLEYVRVCDAFGTGFFYIPGTETCLKFGGYVRTQIDFEDDLAIKNRKTFTRAQFNIDTRTETELGALRGFIEFRADADNSDPSLPFELRQAFIELGGLRVGKFYSWWDDGLSGEADELSTNALFNSIRYTYDAGSFWAGVSVDELEGSRPTLYDVQIFGRFAGFTIFSADTKAEGNIGVTVGLGAELNDSKFQVIGGYDADQQDGSVRLIGNSDIGSGTIGIAGLWASGGNAYYSESEWAVAAEYAIKVSDKLTVTPGAQWFGNTADNFSFVNSISTIFSQPIVGRRGDEFSSRDAWTAGVAVNYEFTKGLKTKVALNYNDEDDRDKKLSGFVRLQRSF